MKHGQRGISFIGFLAVGAGLVAGGIVAAQVIPTVLEFQAATKAATKAASGATVPDIRSSFDKASQIDDILAVSGKDLVITKEGDKAVVSFSYNKEIHLVGHAYLLLKYAGHSR